VLTVRAQPWLHGSDLGTHQAGAPSIQTGSWSTRRIGCSVHTPG